MDNLVMLREFAKKIGMTQKALALRLKSDFLSPKPMRIVNHYSFYSEQELMKWHIVYEDMLDVRFRHREEFNGIQL